VGYGGFMATRTRGAAERADSSRERGVITAARRPYETMRERDRRAALTMVLGPKAADIVMSEEPERWS
jgi:hypothetical protein